MHHDDCRGGRGEYGGPGRGKGEGRGRARDEGRGRGREPEGFGPRGGGRRGGSGRPRARRGDVRWALLYLLEESPSNGYGLMKRIEEKTDSVWRPSPGSVYPTLTQLVDEELLLARDAADGKQEYDLTDRGRAYVEENRSRIDKVWQPAEERFQAVGPLMEASRGVMETSRAIGEFGSEEQNAQAVEVLRETRMALLDILDD